VLNPCPRVEHPLWVKRILQESISKRKQATISSLFALRADAVGAPRLNNGLLAPSPLSHLCQESKAKCRHRSSWLISKTLDLEERTKVPASWFK
jgi:hypothetical protein